jgi:hypothetical protein
VRLARGDDPDVCLHGPVYALDGAFGSTRSST